MYVPDFQILTFRGSASTLSPIVRSVSCHPLCLLSPTLSPVVHSVSYRPLCLWRAMLKVLCPLAQEEVVCACATRVFRASLAAAPPLLEVTYDGTMADFGASATLAGAALRKLRQDVRVRRVVSLAARPYAYSRLGLATGGCLVVTHGGSPIVRMESTGHVQCVPVYIEASDVLAKLREEEQQQQRAWQDSRAVAADPVESVLVLGIFLAWLAGMIYFCAYPCIVTSGRQVCYE